MTNRSPSDFKAVIFDLGGVVLGSPLHAIRRYESELGIPEGSINRVVVDTAPTGAWSRLERGELDLERFYRDFESDCAEAGHQISGRDLMEAIGLESQPRPAMLTAIGRIRTRGLSVAALTNNWATDDGTSNTDGLRPAFDQCIESAVEGLRKPDPRIYQLACARLEIEPREAVFLDDIGGNLKSARALGMHTIRVADPHEALGELEIALGFSLRHP